MRNRWLLAATVGLFSLSCALVVSGQNPTVAGQYVISAKAGGVNFVSGKVSVMRKSGTSGLLLAGDDIQIGDRVTTGDDGKAEILLNPGSYLRLGPMSSFDFVSTDLENLKINLRAGSAIFEVIAADEFRVSLKLPQTSIVLNRSGVFRVDVLGDGNGRISVFKGQAYLGNTKVNSGRAATVTKTGVSVSKFDRDTDDPLDIWAKSRAKELTKLNAKLQRDSLRNTLLSSFGQRGWNVYNSFGLWVFDPYYRGWFFLPFGYGWSSPYGWDYSYDLWRCRMPWYVWNNPYPTGGPTTGGGGPVVTTPNQAVIREERRVRMHTPPFQRVQESAVRSSDSSPVFRNTNTIETRSNRSDGSISMPTISSPPVSAPPPPSAPPPQMPIRSERGKPGLDR
jgi:hypothetical protein